jgi:glycosyltransferase involved in cell wall biosynthesis
MEAVLLRLGQYLRRQGCEVEAITTIEPGEWFDRWSEFHIKADLVPGYRPSPLNPLAHSLRVGARLAAGRYDVVILNHTRHAQAVLARLPENVIVIPVLHNDVEQIYEVGCANAEAWNVAVAVSPKVAATARQRVPHRPVVHIPSGVDLPAEAAWQKRQALGKRIELAFVGRLEQAQKGVLCLPDIYQACLDRGIDATLTIVGDGPDAEALQRKLSDRGLQDRTRRLKGLTPEQVYAVLLDAHVLLLPSQYEGLPIVLLESQACGCVPIASRLPGMTDAAVLDGETGLLVDVGDVAGFADAVATLYHDPARWSQLSRAGHDRVRRKFSVEVMGGAYLGLAADARKGQYPLPRPRRHRPPVDLSLFSWRDFLPDPLRRWGRRGRAWLAAFSATGKATTSRW